VYFKEKNCKEDVEADSYYLYGNGGLAFRCYTEEKKKTVALFAPGIWAFFRELKSLNKLNRQ
jgi:hypothetical protein